MEYFRFTPFNCITLFVMGLTLAMVVARARRSGGNWALAYYAAILAFAIGFPYSLNLFWVAAGLAAGLLIRFRPRNAPVRVAEYGVLAYVFARCVGLILMW
jgi:hypothetical protein